MAEFVVNLKQERNAFAHNVGQAITVKSEFKDVFDHVKMEGVMLMVFVIVLLVILVLNVNQVILFIYLYFFFYFLIN